MADATIKLAKTVNFGSSLGGRQAHVFYEVFDTLGTGSISRTNAGIYELGTSSGIYGAQLNLAQTFSGSIVWQVTGSSGNIVFASDEVELDNRITRQFTTGRWKIDETTNEMIFYQSDNTTEMGRFDLKDRNENASFTEVFERVRK